MLANLLAIVVGLGSLGFYLSAFILPEVHRRSDFFWSGVGMFYAVVLWYCARQMNGAVLLGQTAAVGLLLWLGYQTLLLRRETTPSAQQTPIRLCKSERSRPVSRPIIKDYEFVEDGVEDALDREPDPDSPVLIQSAADEFAPKIVVPAAISKPAAKKEPSSDDSPVSPEPTPKREKPNPIEAVGVFVGWLKEIATPKKKEPTPMIELPPRPPSIPKPDSQSDATPLSASTDTSSPPATAAGIVQLSSPEILDEDVSASAIANPPPDNVSVPSSASSAQADEETNWPDDEFWD